MIAVSSKSQDTMIAIAYKAFFLYRGHKRAPELPGVHVSSVECLDRAWRTCPTLMRTWESLKPNRTWRARRERAGIRGRPPAEP